MIARYKYVDSSKTPIYVNKWNYADGILKTHFN